MDFNRTIFFILLISSIIFLPFELKSEEKDNIKKPKYTNYSVNIGGSLDYDIYNSSFSRLPGASNCCEIDNILFKKADGLGSSFWIGFTKHVKLPIIQSDADLNLKLNLVNFSAKYLEKAKIGNYIENNSIKDIISQQVLAPDVKSLILSPSISIFPFDKKKIPVAVCIGFNSGVILNINYEMYEELLQPTEALFENGEKIRNNFNKTLKDNSFFIFSLMGGVSYELLKIKNFTISPQLTFNFGISDFLKDTKWKSNSFNFGINLAYRFAEVEKAPPVPPKAPPVPALPLPKEKQFEIHVKSKLNEHEELTSGDSIIFNVYTTETIRRETLLPILFFETNSSEFIKEYSDDVIKNILTNSNNITIGLLANESENLKSKRKNTILDLYKKHNLDTHNINFTYIISEHKKRHSEIEGEMAYAKFGNNLIIREQFNYLIDSIEKKSIETNVLVNSEDEDYKCEIKYNIISKQNNRLINTSEETISGTKLTLDIDKYFKNINLELLSDSNIYTKNTSQYLDNTYNQDVLLNITTTTASQKKIIKNLEFYLKPDVRIQQFVNSEAQNYFTEEYVLGFFDFDGREFTQIDTNIINKILLYLEAGRTIEIIGKTDDFGTRQYNKILATERAEVAKKLFPEKYNISLGIDLKTNESQKIEYSPYHRLQNRVAIVRVLK